MQKGRTQSQHYRQVLYQQGDPVIPQQGQQGVMQTPGVMYLPNGQMPNIRPPYAARMQFPNQYVQNQDQVFTGQRYVRPGGYAAVNYNTQQNFQPNYGQQQQNFRHVFIQPQMAGNSYMNVSQQHIHPPSGPIPQQHMVYNHQPNTLIHNNQPPHLHTNDQGSGIAMQMSQQPQQPLSQPQKKRPQIVLKDPNTGKDVTSEILKKKNSAPTQRPIAQLSQPAPPTVTTDDNNAKLQANAAFAAQVAALSKKENPSESVPVTTKESTDIITEPIVDTTPVEAEASIEPVKAVETTNDTENASEKNPTEEVPKPTEASVIEESTKPALEEPTPITEDTVQTTIPDTKLDQIETKPTPEDTPLKSSEELSEDQTTPSEIAVVEAVPAAAVDSNDDADGDVLVNGHEELSKGQMPVAKKKKKQRLKDLESKENNPTSLLSAFTDVPQKEELQKVEPVKKHEDKPNRETTWEDKEKTIDKEDIKNEDAEPEVAPQQAKVTVVQTEGTDESTEEEKLQYDREFLLKFQFNPICTNKPPNLPNIEIVLDTAHQPTKPLNPSQKMSNNDFMPSFMRQASGGRSSSRGGSKDKKGSSSAGGSKPQKVIQIPQFEKIELKKSENAWVRPKDSAKEMPEEVREKDELGRNVRSILNKLTPQKFRTLIDQMTALKINSEEKLELAIALIFEKAISEPGFSVAYANMCRVLTDAFKAIPDASGKQSNIFRKILLNKCQKEFEKDKVDEKQMEEDRNKTFENELERKAWLEELDYRELKTRRRTLGNIRFIGELFKLKMISEKIMHECILKLLRSSKQETMEEQLECLCKLLTTIGKDLDHQEAKPRMDQYFQQIQKIIEKKKISSRIRFALQDVQDLRTSGWVPRRDEGNPKTIDQIHREAQQKEKEAEIQRQQDKLKRSEPRRGAGGRDSPVVRSGGSGGGSGGTSNADGWTNVPMKTSRIAPTPVDASKFKIKKNDSSEVSLGPGGRPGAWSRGASGGTNSRSGSGSNTPTTEIDQKPNRYDILSDSTSTPFSDGKRGQRQSNLRKSSQGASSNTRRPFDDRNSALRAVKDMTGNSSRNQSPVLSGDSSRNSPSSSGAQTPVDAVSPNPSSVDDEKMRKVTKSTLEEFFSVGDYKEANMCIKELEAPKLHNVFIEEAFVIATEKKHDERIKTGKLISYLVKENLIKNSELVSGLSSVVELAPDLAVDIPLFYKYLGEILGPIVSQKTLPLLELKDLLAPLMQFNKVGLVVAETLNNAAEHISSKESVAELWQQSGLSWDQLLENGSNVEDFIKDKKLDYTVVKAAPSKEPSHASRIQDELLKSLRGKADNKNVMDFIDNSLSKEESSSPDFIRELSYNVCKSAIFEDNKDKSCKCDKEGFKGRKNILLRYINANKDLELQAAFAVQQLVTDLNHPRGLLTEFFEELYDGDVISEETFYNWENSKECPDGKGNALSDVKAFLTWLKKAEEESNEEDSTATPGLNSKN